MKRTHFCGNLRTDHIGEEVILAGWVNTIRDLGGCIFLDLRDITGICQIVFKGESMLTQARKLKPEFVIKIGGKVIKRTNINPQLPTGEIEIEAEHLEIISPSKILPFKIQDQVQAKEDLRFKYRYLDLRRSPLAKNIIFRSKLTYLTREYLNSKGFIEIETPILSKSTPEGARDYLVPSRLHSGKFFALPQSPQLFKQLLMIAGFDKYFQISRCFRDEDLRKDRQPEFTQIDIEMSFVEPEDVRRTIDGLMAYLLERLLQVRIQLPIPCLSYEEALRQYGSDTPDTRFDLKIHDLTKCVSTSEFQIFKQAGAVKGINVKDWDPSRSELDEINKLAKRLGAKGILWVKIQDNDWSSPFSKRLSLKEKEEISKEMALSPGDVALFVADRPMVALDVLGKLRVEIAKRLNLIPEGQYKLLWITDFPMFEYSQENKRWECVHHPFTSPYPEHFSFFETCPEKVKALSYDLVMNGIELGGGSIRVHRPELQLKIFKFLKMSDQEIKDKFGFFLEALEYGAPPHGGIALGLDRIIMILRGENSIREVIPFPKTYKATCLLTNSPSEVREEQLKELNIKKEV